MNIDGSSASGGCMVNVGGSVYQWLNVDQNGCVQVGMGSQGSATNNGFCQFQRVPLNAPTQTRNFKVLDSADTARTASTEFINAYFTANVVRQWATGALALQRDHAFDGGPIGFVGASTCAQAATLGIGSAPSAGTNCTLTDAYGLLTASGVRAGFGGALVGNLQGLPLGVLAYTWPSDANQTLSASQAANPILILSGGSLGATRNLIMPANPPTGAVYIVKNGTTGAQSVQIIGQSGTGITIATGKTAMVAFDGTNFIRLTADV